MMFDPEVHLVVSPSLIAVRGNALASGEEEIDKEVEEEIYRRLTAGEIWAWCDVEVIAEFRGLRGNATLGCCSYRDAEDFKNSSGYYPQLVREAVDELADKLEGLQGCVINREIGVPQNAPVEEVF